MKRWTPLFLLFFVFLLVFAVSAQTPGGKPKMVIDQETYDAGQMYRTGEKLEHAFVLKNQGNADLMIYSATPG